MNRFLDTCAVISYCYPVHMFNSRCAEITMIKKLWVSSNVLYEWDKKESTVLYEHGAALLEHIQYIKSNCQGTIEKEEMDKLAYFAPDLVRPFMEVVYKKLPQSIPADLLCAMLTKLQMDLRDISKKRFKSLESLWEVHERDIDYPEKSKLLERYAHEQDIYISCLMRTI